MPMRTAETIADYWRIAADDLGLAVVTPFELQLPSGQRVRAEALVESFGAPRGMLIFTDAAAVLPYDDEIEQAGYGFSVMDNPGPGAIYQASDVQVVLNDWGWGGEDSDRPAWVDD